MPKSNIAMILTPLLIYGMWSGVGPSKDIKRHAFKRDWITCS